MNVEHNTKIIKRLNTVLPDHLAQYVGAITGKSGDYETPSEFIRDLIRRHMEKTQAKEEKEVQTLLMQSLAEQDYSPWTSNDLQDARDLLKR